MPEPLGAFDPTTTYDEAVTEYEDASSEFWRYLSDHALQLLRLRPGERVLDVPCGTGHSALPVAQQVGPSGRVVALDVSERMVALVREKAARLGLANLDVNVADMADLGPADEPFDAVVCWASSSCPTCPPRWASRCAGPSRRARSQWRSSASRSTNRCAPPSSTPYTRGARRRSDRALARVRTQSDLRDLFEAAGLDDVLINERSTTSHWLRPTTGGGS